MVNMLRRITVNEQGLLFGCRLSTRDRMVTIGIGSLSIINIMVFVAATVDTFPTIMGQEPIQERFNWIGEYVMGCINAQKQRIVAAFQYRHQMQDHPYWRLRIAIDI